MFSLANKMTQLLISTTDKPVPQPAEPPENNISPKSVSSSRPRNQSMHSPKSDEDSDDKFFDAMDNSLVSLAERGSSVTGGDLDYDESCFFDTATSRHQSELSDYPAMNTPLSPRQIRLSDCFDEDETVAATVVENESEQLSNASTLLATSSRQVVVVSDETSQEQHHSSTRQANGIKIKINGLESNEDSGGDEDEADDEENELDPELETPWTFWIDRCFRGTSKDQYEAGLKLIHTVKTVKTFWSIFNNIPDVSVLPNNYNYHLMRNTRRPLWEDPENARGGLWKFRCRKEDTSIVWSEALLAAIGEQLSDCVASKDEIIGISVGRRDKEDIVQIWNLNAKYETEASVCSKMQHLLPNVKFSVVFYKAHEIYDNSVPNPSVANTNANYHHNASNSYSKNNGHFKPPSNNNNTNASNNANSNTFYNNNLNPFPGTGFKGNSSMSNTNHHHQQHMYNTNNAYVSGSGGGGGKHSNRTK